ncbi:MAG: DUF2341 domain-containing protein, partial [Methanobacterium paludis]|nr:DUF2341 domain-containing protein [Methanobacterium paludis]
MRFVLLDGTELSYSLEDYTTGVSADFLVKLPSLPKSPTVTDVYVLFGNPNVTTTSNPSAVYELFDDFSDNDISDWTQVYGTWTVANGIVSVPGNRDGISRMKKAFSDDNTPKRYRVKVRHPSSGNYNWATLQVKSSNTDYGGAPGNDQGYQVLFYGPSMNMVRIFRADAGSQNELHSSVSYTNTTNTWHTVDIYVINGTIIVKVNGTQIFSVTDSTYSTGEVIRLQSDNYDFGHDFDELSVLQTTANPPTVSTLGASGINSQTVTETLIIQGNVLYDSPMIAPQLPDKEIYITIDGVEYPIGGSYSIEDRGNDATSTFGVSIITSEDLYLVSGQVVKFMERNKDPNGFYTGVLQKIVDHDEPAGRVYTLTGRDFANTLVTQSFTLSAVETSPTTYTSYEILDLILTDTNILLGPSVDITVTGITNQNDVYKGYAGNWSTKSAALNDLLALVSTIKGINIHWFIDSNGLLRLFYTDSPDLDVGISIYKTNPRKYTLEYTEDSENIINYQTGTGGSDNTLTSTKEDLESINGWIDANTGIKWPGYGKKPGTPIQNSKIITQTELDYATQNVIDLYSKPIFTITMTLSRFPEVEIGQPVYIPDHYKLRGMTFVITER